MVQEPRVTAAGQLDQLHRRTIDNVTGEANQKEKQEQEDRRRKDAHYCENCNMMFEKVEEHYKEKTHQTFIQDQNNFKELDLLLAKTRRVYKQPLPEFMRNIVYDHIDGPNVVFAGVKRGFSSTSLPQEEPQHFAKKQK